MKKKPTPSPVFAQQPQEVHLSRSPDVQLIKSRMSTANLYLSLLDKRFFSVNDFSAADQSTVATIEAEIHDFVLERVKTLFGEGSTETGAFTGTEVRALKLLAAALEKKATTKEQPKQIELPSNLEMLIVDSSDDDDLSETDFVDQPVVMVKKKPVAKAKPNVLKRKVTIMDENGNTKEVESVTQKIVQSPPGLRRHPPATFEQQMQLAHNNVNAIQGSLSQIAQQSGRTALDDK